MVDKENRLKAASLIQAFRQGGITNDQFVHAFPHSHDQAIQAISSMLWFCYDDLHVHRLAGKHALTVEGETMVDRCILFLNTNLEYSGETNFASLLAPLKKILALGNTESPKEAHFVRENPPNRRRPRIPETRCRDGQGAARRAIQDASR
jgi:hypothetical protein